LPSGRDVDLGLRVTSACERGAQEDGHVERRVAESADDHGAKPKISRMDGEEKRRSVRSFLLGGIVGASAVAATLNRRRRIQHRRGHPRGLAAFESAPCYLEILESEREREPAP
jgi:hypothetical protein